MDSSNCASNPPPNCAAASTIGSTTSQTFITALAADPAAAGTVYATVNSFQGAQKLHVFKSTNYGKTWTDASRLIGPEEAPGLPDQPYMSLAINPAHPSDIYVGGVIGVFASTNGGASWSVLGKSLPNAAVYDLTVSQDGNTLDAWTHGRGVWELSGAALP
jgi:hypothetical protein